jgi:GTP cyclohydrolase I
MYKYSYAEYKKDIISFTKLIKEVKPDIIIGIAKGGLSPATEVARYFDIPMYTIGIKSYKDKKKDQIVIYQDLPTDINFSDLTIVIVDDIVDSGETMNYAKNAHFMRHKRCYTASLYYKPNKILKPDFFIHETDKWIEFPWEREITLEETAKDILIQIGEDPSREGLLETPKRIAKMWTEIYSSYTEEMPILKTFDSNNNEMIIKSFKAYSYCEHHLALIDMNITFAYIPKGKVVGISKIIRLARWCASRLTIQENLTEQIVDTFIKELNPLGAACVIKGQHYCERLRGVHADSITTTACMKGVFYSKPATRAEFLQYINNH